MGPLHTFCSIFPFLSILFSLPQILTSILSFASHSKQTKNIIAFMSITTFELKKCVQETRGLQCVTFNPSSTCVKSVSCANTCDLYSGTWTEKKKSTLFLGGGYSKVSTWFFPTSRALILQFREPMWGHLQLLILSVRTMALDSGK